MSGETGPLDDAAVVRPEGAEREQVLTLDVITPIVDDAAAFGRIAAANALSDVYAMGGQPEVALSFIGVPDVVGMDVVEQILRGASEKCVEARCAIVGGHSIRDAEPKLGLAVVGSVEKGRAWTHRGAKPGQVLVLTKPIGTGVVAQALRAGTADPAHVAEATRWMETLNAAARDAGERAGETAATDVTGFGLLGHLMHMASASGVGAVVETARVPLLSGAHAAAAEGRVPGGSKRNLKYVENSLVGAAALDPTLLTLLSDAQTSGGLLLAVAADRADDLCAELGAPAARVGRLVAEHPGKLALI